VREAVDSSPLSERDLLQPPYRSPSPLSPLSPGGIDEMPPPGGHISDFYDRTRAGPRGHMWQLGPEASDQQRARFFTDLTRRNSTRQGLQVLRVCAIGSLDRRNGAFHGLASCKGLCKAVGLAVVTEEVARASSLLPCKVCLAAQWGRPNAFAPEMAQALW
jgi:hypothetical protein